MEYSESKTKTRKKVEPLEALTVAKFRFFGDLGLAIFSIFLIIPILGEITGQLLFVGLFTIVFSSGIGLLLIRRSRKIAGLNFVVYGLIFGLWIISIVVDGLGFFSLFTMVFITALSVATTVPRNYAVRAILTSVIFGILSLLLDLLLPGTIEFRVDSPAALQPVLWAVISALALIFTGTIIRYFSLFTLRTKIIVSFLFISLTPLFTIAILNNFSSKAALSEGASQALFAAASQTEDSIKDFLNANAAAVRTESQLPSLVEYLQLHPDEREGSILEDQVSDTLRTLSTKDEGQISSYALLDLNGNNLVDTDFLDIGTNKSDREYFIQAISMGDSFTSPVEISVRSGRPSIYFSNVVTNSTAEVVGVLRVRFNASVLQNLIVRSNNLIGQDSFGVLFDENFLHLAHGIAPETMFQTVSPLEDSLFQELKDARRMPDLPSEELFLDLPDLEEQLIKAVESEDGVVFFTAEDVATGDRKNQAVVIAFQDPPWLLTFFQPQDVFLNPVLAQTNTTILLSIVVSGIVVALAIFIAQILTRPIARLTKVATIISEGNLEARAAVETNDEIGFLAEAFNGMTEQISELVSNLEDQVLDRTQALEKRAIRLQTAAESARDATSEQELSELINQAVNIICERFNFYHVGIYLLDDRAEYAILRAGSNESGESLVNSKHRVIKNSESNVGYVAMVGVEKLASTEKLETSIDVHALLPETRSQMVLPLKIGELILGVLDIQSSDPRAFDESDFAIFRTLADQLAIAIQKTSLREEVEQALSELESAYGLYTKDSWKKFLGRKNISSGYRYDQVSIEPVNSIPEAVSQALREGKKIEIDSGDTNIEDNEKSILAVPMKIRGEVIGVLNLEFDSDQVPSDTSSLVEDIADRLTLVLENARLVESAQSRVEQEKLTNELSNNFRSSLDMDSILKNAVEEIGSALNLHEVEIRMGSQNNNSSEMNGSSNGSADSADF